MTMLLPTDTARRVAGTGHELGLGQARAFKGRLTTKSKNNMKELALPAKAGSAVAVAVCGAGRWSDEPMPRADHKAKRHGRLRPTKYKRQARDKWDLLEADL